jgi:hypothetical protein
MVSIHSRLIGREIHGGGRMTGVEVVFQSTPGLLAGRYGFAAVP